MYKLLAKRALIRVGLTSAKDVAIQTKIFGSSMTSLIVSKDGWMILWK